MQKAYSAGLDLVVRETPLNYKDLPQNCPHGLEQILDSVFLPGQRTAAEQEWME